MDGNTISNDVTLAGESAKMMLANRYRIIRQLGQGGMGSVWLAEDTLLDNRQCAVKMLPSILVANKRAYKQLKAEALVSMRLIHPNIVTLRAFEENGGNPFLLMDYIDGITLDEYLSEKGCLTEDETIKLLKPVAEALDYAHAEGVVHRDVKPANIMIRKDGCPFVLDFGIAREIQETMTRVTGKLSSGTLLYMSPEQLNGDSPKPTQDVYSFSAMVYECLSGRPPFWRGGIEDQIKTKLPEHLPAEIGIADSVMQGLSKVPESRPRCCKQVLLRAAEKGAARAAASGAKRCADPLTVKASDSAVGKHFRRAQVAIAVIIAVAVGVGLFCWDGFTSGAEETDARRRRAELERLYQQVCAVSGEFGFDRLKGEAGNAVGAVDGYLVHERWIGANEQCIKAEAELKRILAADVDRKLALNKLSLAKKEKENAERLSASSLVFEQWHRAVNVFESGMKEMQQMAFSKASVSFSEAARLFKLAVEAAVECTRRTQNAQIVADIAAKSKELQPRLTKIDDADGFKNKKDAAAEILKQAKSYREQSQIHLAALFFTNYVNECKRLLALDVERESVKNLKESAESAKSRADAAEVPKFMIAQWNKALRLMEEANRLCGDMNFTDAFVLYNQSKDLFEDCIRDVARVKKNVLEQQSYELKRRAKWPKEGREFVVKDPVILNLTMKWCPPGSFLMGSPESEQGRDCDEAQHHVTLTRGFWMGETEVTQDQWRQVMNGLTVLDQARRALRDETKYDFSGKLQTISESRGLTEHAPPELLCGDIKGNIPIYHVNWFEAMDFCRRLTEQERSAGRLPDGYAYRLPTEAEWEYACRAGNPGTLYNGHPLNIVGSMNAPALDDIAWYGGNSSLGFGIGRGIDTGDWEQKQYSGGLAFVREVKGKAPNAWGIYDMLGNVVEWCIDNGSGYRISGVSVDPVGRLGNYRYKATRGGAWSSFAKNVRPATRFRDLPQIRSWNIGFRVALAPVSEELKPLLDLPPDAAVSEKPGTPAKQQELGMKFKALLVPKPEAQQVSQRNDTGSGVRVLEAYEAPTVILRPFVIENGVKKYITATIDLLQIQKEVNVRNESNNFGGTDVVVRSVGGVSASMVTLCHKKMKKRIPVSFKPGRSVVCEVQFDGE